MSKLVNTTDTAEDAGTPTTKRYGNGIVAETTIGASAVQEDASAGSVSIGRTEAKASSAPIEGRAVSASPRAWPWQGGPSGWASQANPWSWPRGPMPTTVITLASTVTYTQSAPAVYVSEPAAPASMTSRIDVSQSLAPASTTSEVKTNDTGISGAAAAGIGIGASVGLLGFGVGIAYLCNKHLHRRRRQRQRQRSREQTLESRGSDEYKANDDGFWPPYPYSASNESPVELSSVRQAQEMCAKSKPLEMDASSCSEIVMLDGRGR